MRPFHTRLAKVLNADRKPFPTWARSLRGKPDCWCGDACRGDGSPHYTRVYIQSIYSRVYCVVTDRHAIQCFARVNVTKAEPPSISKPETESRAGREQNPRIDRVIGRNEKLKNPFYVHPISQREGGDQHRSSHGITTAVATLSPLSQINARARGTLGYHINITFRASGKTRASARRGPLTRPYGRCSRGRRIYREARRRNEVFNFLPPLPPLRSPSPPPRSAPSLPLHRSVSLVERARPGTESNVKLKSELELSTGSKQEPTVKFEFQWRVKPISR
ncbi:hypothetical protein EVAR_20795_1 [Eumeta japonica]|uniref:Uncharacterized protein n=1 Tax=Eumeta variegata TaxID=151549 RepID=A0A4C1UDE8_EUMVA|nr:hypothetical protein EVAR_20795_1 [Eumeta japonica]